jgi:putative FmdB family regulatory protein
MPLYEYHCEACGRRFEVIRKFSDPELDVCTLCGKGPVQRQVSSPAIQFNTDVHHRLFVGAVRRDSSTPSTGDSKATTQPPAPNKTDSAPSKTETSAPATKPATTDS